MRRRRKQEQKKLSSDDQLLVRVTQLEAQQSRLVEALDQIYEDLERTQAHLGKLTRLLIESTGGGQGASYHVAPPEVVD